MRKIRETHTHTQANTYKKIVLHIGSLHSFRLFPLCFVLYFSSAFLWHFHFLPSFLPWQHPLSSTPTSQRWTPVNLSSTTFFPLPPTLSACHHPTHSHPLLSTRKASRITSSRAGEVIVVVLVVDFCGQNGGPGIPPNSATNSFPSHLSEALCFLAEFGGFVRYRQPLAEWPEEEVRGMTSPCLCGDEAAGIHELSQVSCWCTRNMLFV